MACTCNRPRILRRQRSRYTYAADLILIRQRGPKPYGVGRDIDGFCLHRKDHATFAEALRDLDTRESI